MRDGQLVRIAFTSDEENGLKRVVRCEKWKGPSVKTGQSFLGTAPKNRVIFGARLDVYSR